MANLREYFFKELEGFSLHSDLTLTTATGEKIVVVQQINFDTLAGVNFVSYFFPAGTFTLPLAKHLLDNLSVALDRANNDVSAKVSHPISDPEG